MSSGGKRYRAESDGAGRGGGVKKAKKTVKTVFSGFWDEGVVAEDGSIDYNGLNLTIGKDIYEVRVGDAVMMRGDDDHGGQGNLDRKPAAQMTEPKVGDGLMLARVERIWQEKSKGGRSGKILFQARWFLKVRIWHESEDVFDWPHNMMIDSNNSVWSAPCLDCFFSFSQKEDIDSLPLNEITGPLSAENFVNSITEHDLVLSNQSDDNHVTTISGLIQGTHRNIVSWFFEFSL